MATEETREQQQMYNIFRSCIYIFLIMELVMNLPIPAYDRVTGFLLELLGRFRIFNSVVSCKFLELICIGVTCIGTRAKKKPEVQCQDDGRLSDHCRILPDDYLYCRS